MREPVLRLLGLAARGGKLVYGETALAQLTSHKFRVVVLASDASDLTAKTVFLKAARAGVDVIYDVGSKAALGHALGKGNIALLGIADIHLAKKIQQLVKDGDSDGL